MRFLRRAGLPPEVGRTLALDPKDAVLAAARLTDGWAVATRDGLAVAPEDGQRPHLHPWPTVDGARFDPELPALEVTWVDGTPPMTLTFTARRPARLVRTVHERVQASVVHREAVTLRDGSVVRVVLRRGAGGGIFTQVIGTGRVDLDDPATAAEVDAAEARVREAAGLD